MNGLKLSLICSLLVSFLAGCAQYQPLPESDPQALRLAPIVNQSPLPQVIAPLSRNLRNQLAHSRFWRISENPAHPQLRVTLLEREQRAMARDPLDSGRPLSFLQTVQVQLEWDGNSPAPWGGDEPLRFDVESILYSEPNLVDARSQDVNRLAQEIAREIIRHLDWREQ